MPWCASEALFLVYNSPMFSKPNSSVLQVTYRLPLYLSGEVGFLCYICCHSVMPYFFYPIQKQLEHSTLFNVIIQAV